MNSPITSSLLLICFLAASSFVSAQNVLSGKVLDEDGLPLVGASLFVVGTSTGAITDGDGSFIFTSLPTSAVRLRVSMIGYGDEVVDTDLAGTSSPLTIRLTESGEQLSAVIVTATKRAVEAQNVPLAIATIDSKEIERLRIDNINKVGRSIPNFRTYDDGGGSFPLITVRGIGTSSDVPIVGIYVDDIPLFNTVSFPSVLQNIERIEVLRGAQGTLYGRNSIGGVINIVTKQPTNKTSGFVSVGYGSLNQLETKAGFSTPLIKEKLFFGVDGSFSSRDGYITNTFLDQTELLGRKLYGATARLSWLVNDRWTVNLRSGTEFRDVNAYALAGAIGNTGADLDSLRINHPYEVSYNTEGRYKTLLTNNALKLNYYGERLFFKSISTLQTTHGKVDEDEFDFTQFDLNSNSVDRTLTTFGQEFRVGSNDNDAAFSWLAGAFLYHYISDGATNITAGADNVLFAPSPEIAAQYPYIQRQNTVLTQTGISLYANGDYKLTPKLTATLGVRFETERSASDNKNSFSRNGDEGYSFAPLGLIPVSFSESVNFNAFSPKAGLSYQLAENRLLYGSIGRGYRPGGINAFNTDAGKVKYDPEFTWNYELGFKSTLLENKMRFNLTGFYIDYTDQQLFTVTDLTTFSLGNENIGKSISYGLELESELLVTKGLTASVDVGWLETEIKEFSVVGFAGEVDNAGNTNAYAPTWNGTVGLAYSTKIDKITLGASADYQFQTDMFLDPENQYQQPAYGLLNAQLSARLKNYELSLWGTNMTDEIYFSYGYALPGFGGFASYGLPRMVGTSLTIKF